jgi:hypothetical protein
MGGAHKQAPLQKAYIADVYAACRTLQGCSDVLTCGLLAIQRQASAVQDRPQVDVRASFVDAVKYFSAQHGPTDSLFVDKEGQFHHNEGVTVADRLTIGGWCCTCSTPRDRTALD